MTDQAANPAANGASPAAAMIWRELARLGRAAGATSMRELFSSDQQRFQRLSVRDGDMLLDVSKTLLTEASLAVLLDLARATQVEAKRDDMFAGKSINVTEGRAVLHTALSAMACAAAGSRRLTASLSRTSSISGSEALILAPPW